MQPIIKPPVRLVAALPHEVKSGGEGWTLTAGFADSPFGRCLIAESPRGICHLSFVSSAGDPAALRGLQQQWPRAKIRRSDSFARDFTSQIFAKPSRRDPRH